MTAVVLLIMFLGIQFIPSNRDGIDVVPITDFILVNNIPDRIANKLLVSCYDCHSNNNRYPWYSKIQPVGWLIENHINKGKVELNFSKWDDYSVRRKKSKLKSIISQILNDKMPLSSYTFLHRDANISETEKQQIVQWMTQLKNRL